MAVKITKMRPEVHEAYVRDKRDSEIEAAAGGFSAGNTPGVKKIPLQRDIVLGKEEGVAGSSKDPRVNHGDTPKVVQTLVEVHYDARDVESDSAEEEEEFSRAEVERIQINLPSEAYAVPYGNVADIIMPILLGDDESGCESGNDIMINIDAEAEELAREEEEAEGQAMIKEISRELEESSREAGLLPLPPIASILPIRGKGRVMNTTATTPGGTSVPRGSFTPGGTSVPGGSSTSVSTSVPGHPLTPVGASAPRIRSTPGGPSAPGSLKVSGDTSVSGDPTISKGASAPRICLTPGGASVPGGLTAPVSTTVPGCSSATGGASASGGVMALGGTSVVGGQSKVLTINAMIARKTPGGTSVPGGQIVSGGASASGDTSIIEGTPILRTQVNRGCTTVTASMAAPEDTTILKCVSLTRHLSSQNSMVAPGIVVTPDLGPPLNMDVELKAERAAPMRIGGKKIKRDNDPSKGATYAMLDETMSSISDRSSVSNSGMRQKRATAEDEDSVVIGRHHTGRNKINPHGRRGGEEDDGEATGSVVRDVRGSRDIWGGQDGERVGRRSRRRQ